MAFTKFTGKSATTTCVFGALTMPSWRKITITEKGKPATKTVDVTVESDSSYTEIDDPMGGKGSATGTVAVEGLLSSKDSADSGIVEQAVGGTGNVVVTTAAGGSVFTLTGATFQSFKTSAKIGDSVPYTATFELTTASGTWA